MAALIAATVAALEMVRGGKDRIPECIEIIVGLRRNFDRTGPNRRPYFLQDGIDVKAIARKPGNSLEA